MHAPFRSLDGGAGSVSGAAGEDGGLAVKGDFGFQHDRPDAVEVKFELFRSSAAQGDRCEGEGTEDHVKYRKPDSAGRDLSQGRCTAINQVIAHPVTAHADPGAI